MFFVRFALAMEIKIHKCEHRFRYYGREFIMGVSKKKNLIAIFLKFFFANNRIGFSAIWVRTQRQIGNVNVNVMCHVKLRIGFGPPFN